jgi:hypothetical protein
MGVKSIVSKSWSEARERSVSDTEENARGEYHELHNCKQDSDTREWTCPKNIRSWDEAKQKPISQKEKDIIDRMH